MSLFGQLFKYQRKPQIDRLKNKILLEKKKNLNKLKNTNNTIKILVERGELEVRIKGKHD